MQRLGGIAVAAFAVPYGLTALAVASVMQAAVAAFASLWPIRRGLGTRWRDALAAAARPCGGAAAAWCLLLLLADPVGFRLDPVAALSPCGRRRAAGR